MYYRWKVYIVVHSPVVGATYLYGMFIIKSIYLVIMDVNSINIQVKIFLFDVTEWWISEYW